MVLKTRTPTAKRVFQEVDETRQGNVFFFFLIGFVNSNRTYEVGAYHYVILKSLYRR